MRKVPGFCKSGNKCHKLAETVLYAVQYYPGFDPETIPIQDGKYEVRGYFIACASTCISNDAIINLVERIDKHPHS